MKKQKLTNKVVEAFKGGDRYKTGARKGQLKDYSILWDTEPGFGIRYSRKTGVRTYIYQRRAKGQKTERTFTIGNHGERYADRRGRLDVETARVLVAELKAKLVSGIDPIEERQERLAAERRAAEEAAQQADLEKARNITLREVLEDYLENHRTKHGPLRPATQADYRHHVERNLADWADQPVTTITRAMCVERFVELSKRAPGQANSLLIYLRSLLNHARVMKEDEEGNPTILAVNPAARAIKFARLNPEEPRTVRIPLDKVGAVWNLLRERAKKPRTRKSADWISLVLLTGARKKESASLMWSNVNFDDGTITFPKDVTKNHHELVLPMSAPLRQILEARKPERPEVYVFPSRGGKTFFRDPADTIKAIRKIDGLEKLRLHDLRRTLEDVAKECKIDGDTRRALVNHITTDVHGRHYSNANGKALQAAVDAIAAWVTMQGEIAAGRNVVPLHAAATRERGAG